MWGKCWFGSTGGLWKQRPGNQLEDGILIARVEQDPRTWDDEAQVLGSFT